MLIRVPPSPPPAELRVTPGVVVDPDPITTVRRVTRDDGAQAHSATRVVVPRARRAPLSQHAAPLLHAAAMESAATSARWHCPGHQGGDRAATDLARLVGRSTLAADVWMETGDYQRARREAEDLAAAAWGARRAWLLGNGSTAGNLAWLLATLRAGDEVVVVRDAHVSVLSGIALTGARPVWVSPEVHARHGLPVGVTPEAVASALRAHPAARHVVLTSPGYSSTCPDLAVVVGAAWDAGAHRVYVDQAWGPHLGFHPDLPAAALDAGADAAVVSVHKTATALSSGAILLAGGLDDDEIARLDTTVRMTQTTSPLVPLFASIDAARRDLVVGAAGGIQRAVAVARDLRHRIDAVPGVRVLRPDDLDLPARRVDPLKVVVDVRGLGRSGWEVDAELRRRGAPVEGADSDRLFLVVPAVAGDPQATAEHGDGFVAALAAVAAQCRRQDADLTIRDGDADAWRCTVAPREQVCTPAEARYAPTARVPLRLAVGAVAAEPLVPYPPGIPAVVPGERIDADIAEVLERLVAAGAHVHGCADPTLATVAVVAATA